MATKRGASMKPKQTIIKPEFEPLEDLFDKAKKVMLMKIETNIEVSKRIDNLMSVRDTVYRFWPDFDNTTLPNERMERFKKYQKLTTNTYEMLYSKAEEFDLEEFKKGDMKDYFEDLIPDVDTLNTEEDLLKGIIVFQCVQPYGSQMSQIHQMILEEIEKRKAYEEQ